MKKKLITALILTASAILLVAASVLGTMAFLASSSAVSNTFTVGKVGIQMFESKTNKDGKYVNKMDEIIDEPYIVDGLKTSDGNSYELVPNKTYIKDPTIYIIDGSRDSYLFVKVKNGIQTIEKKNDTENPTIEEQMIAYGWQAIKTNSAGEVLYIYVGAGNADNTVKTGELTNIVPVNSNIKEIQVFDTFTVDSDAVVGDYAGAKVTLTAFAIQIDGFSGVKDGLQGYQQAWNAIVGRFPFESGTVYTTENN